MAILTRLKRDEQALLKSNPSGLHCFRRAKFSKRNAQIEHRGHVPDRLRATYLLIGMYEKKRRKAETFEEQIEFAALKAGAEYRWEKELNDLFKSIKLKQGQQVGVVKDWSIATIDPYIG
jgi:hypothetical protein